jgi:hypothetical protein
MSDAADIAADTKHGKPPADSLSHPHEAVQHTKIIR